MRGTSRSSRLDRNPDTDTETFGDDALPLLHMALMGLPILADPGAAVKRAADADALLRRGVSPTTIIKALAPKEMTIERAYDPDQPRVPKGDPEGGRWSGDNSAPQGAEANPPVANPPVSDHPAPENRTSPKSRADLVVTQDLTQSYQRYVSENCQARILRVFPGQYLNCSLAEVIAAAKAGVRATRTACKLPFNKEYAK